MGRRRSILSLDIRVWTLVGFVLISTAQLSVGITNPEDVAAINNLYVSLGSPLLPQWVPNGGDPCAESWQGVSCNGSAISSIIINGANLRGELGTNLGLFSSIKILDFSNNQIGGSIPSSLPITMVHFFLSDNQFTGSIPLSLPYLTQLSDMSLNGNSLAGYIPDVFVPLTGLVNLDLSNNNLSGLLPPSLESLSSLTTLHLQNNQLSGTLDVLQDLPLGDLNVENNRFSGPIPEKLLSIPNFKKNGNLFKSTVGLAPTPTSFPITPPMPPTPVSGASPSVQKPKNQAGQPSASEESNSGKRRNFFTTKRIIWISISGILLLVILALVLMLFIPQHFRRRQEADGFSKKNETIVYKGNRGNSVDKEPLVRLGNEVTKVPRGAVVMEKEENQMKTGGLDAIPKLQNAQAEHVQKASVMPKVEDQKIDMSSFNMIYLPPSLPPSPLSPPPPPPPPVEQVVKPISSTQVTTMRPSTKAPIPASSVKLFTIATLQQYTNSFSHENLIGEGILGTVYRAQLPDGKLLAVKKLDTKVSCQQKDDEFLDLVNSIDRIRHENVVKLMGYCAEHGHHLLIYEYCSNGTLQDALHSDDESKPQLSWSARVRIALEAAKALRYLHEVCEPLVVHRNFKSANVLLDDELSARVSDCGLAPLISSRTVSQLSGHLLSAYGYGAPEFESGTYTHQSDVYSFGVVMLELLTGRKSYDRTRDRGEQFLVRWAIPQLYDIDLLSKMVDPSLNGEYTAKSLSHFADIISRCVQWEPEFRPAMSEVVQDLADMLRREHSTKNEMTNNLD